MVEVATCANGNIVSDTGPKGCWYAALQGKERILTLTEYRCIDYSATAYVTRIFEPFGGHEGRSSERDRNHKQARTD